MYEGNAFEFWDIVDDAFSQIEQLRWSIFFDQYGANYTENTDAYLFGEDGLW